VHAVSFGRWIENELFRSSHDEIDVLVRILVYRRFASVSADPNVCYVGRLI